jgi:integrase
MAKRHTDPYRLFKRGDIYHAYISFVSETGERLQLRETTGATSEQGAVQYCLKRISELQKKIKQQTSGELPSITLNDAFGRYFTEKAQFQSNPSNILTRLSSIKTNLGVTYLHEIDKQVLSNFVALRRQTVKNGTINRELSIISAIKNLADEFWEVRTNKANPLKFKLSEPAENIKYLKDWNVAQAIIDKAPTHLKPIIYTALYTGFRRGNILSLQWEQIDFKNDTITVKVKDKNTVGGKNLTIPMIKQLKDILQAIPRENKYVFNYKGAPITDIKHSWRSIFYKFVEVDTKDIQKDDVIEYRKRIRDGKPTLVPYKQVLIDPALPYINFHTLRHTAMTWIVKSTGDIRVAQKIAGHADIKTTVKYAHVLDEQKRSALEKTFNQ